MVDYRRLAESIVQEFYRRHRYQLRKAPFLDYKGRFRNDMPRTARAAVDRDIHLLEGMFLKIMKEAVRPDGHANPDAVPGIQLRRETRADSSLLNLWAYVDIEGRLHIDGQDLGPVTASVSNDGEYEYFKTIEACHIPRLVELLGGKPGADILALLRREYTGEKSHALERILRESDIPVVLTTYGG